MQRGKKRVKRRYTRYALTSKLRGTEISLVGATGKRKNPIRGQIQNISAGGLCLRTPQPVHVASLLRCEIPFPRVPVSIPTLMQVRWAYKEPTGNSYRVGLQFLL